MSDNNWKWKSKQKYGKVSLRERKTICWKSRTTTKGKIKLIQESSSSILMAMKASLTYKLPETSTKIWCMSHSPSFLSIVRSKFQLSRKGFIIRSCLKRPEWVRNFQTTKNSNILLKNNELSAAHKNTMNIFKNYTNKITQMKIFRKTRKDKLTTHNS